jgi:uncharacterized protein (DUF433 family)
VSLRFASFPLPVTTDHAKILCFFFKHGTLLYQENIPECAKCCLLFPDTAPNISGMSELLQRITVNPEQCGGRPCVRGMRIRVTDVLDLLAEGLSTEQILKEMPDLESDDVRACVAYASRAVGHPVLAA